MLKNQEVLKPMLIKDLGVLPNKSFKYRQRYGVYKCLYCGKEFKASTNSIKTGNTKSCGCLKHKTIIDRNTTHGMSKTRLYSIFCDIKKRCNNQNSSHYSDYGGRGIIICDEWKKDFNSFYNWSIKHGYKKSLTIDRIDNDGNYEPSNCRWVDFFTQARNKQKLSSLNTSGYRGVNYSKRLDKWIARIGVNNKRVYLGLFGSSIDAAKAYDTYVVNNKLEHTMNGVLK